MISVEQAEQIIRSEIRQYGTERVPFNEALGRVLAEDIIADRDLPPYDRVTMDGIAINYAAFENGIRTYKIKGTQAAGDNPIEVNTINECVEIMTGCAMPQSTDTVIRYEDVDIANGQAFIKVAAIRQGQSIHPRGRDRKLGETIITANQTVTSVIVGMAATVGATELVVKRMPRTLIVSTGDELVEVDRSPSPHQIRRSNVYSIQAALDPYCLYTTLLHLPDNLHIVEEKISASLLHFDVILLSGGVSEGKYDYLPEALEELQVKKLFHKVQQRPGKPFWFGKHANGTLIFAFPGNPVSTFMCLYRYFLPWLETSLGSRSTKHLYAILGEDFNFTPPLQYFLQVKVNLADNGELIAAPIEGNGSGDFANLSDANAFMELPLEETNFKMGTPYRIWPFKQIIN